MDVAASAPTLDILAVQDRYNSGFNTPRVTRHRIVRRRFIPFNRYYEPLAGATLVNPWPIRHFDLLHAYNRVPIGPTPYVIGLESHLPRAMGREKGVVAQTLTKEILSDKCRYIIPMSEAGKITFLHQHADNPRLDELEAKTLVRLPNIVVPDITDWFDPSAPMDEMRLTFVGGHFARKGGIVAAKLAEKALEAGLPLKVTIVSSLVNGVWTDPTRESFYEPYMKLLDLPNVTLLKGAPNAKVLEILDRTHMSLLPTLGDTFGYSAIEGMSRYTPVIATALSALPEFINNDNGVLLDMETNEQREWKHVARPDRDTPAFEKVFTDTIERLAEESFAACVALFNDPQALAAKRRAARATVEQKFNATDAGRFWDDLYVKAVAGR